MKESFSVTIHNRQFNVEIGRVIDLEPDFYKANVVMGNVTEKSKMFSIRETVNPERGYPPYSHCTHLGKVTWAEAQAKMWAHINILLTGSHHLEYLTDYAAQDGAYGREMRGFTHYE